tara:strand:+ start:156 stop:1532 length:1377 start_codon:yes stop_codon:yes gene_type:complete
MILNFTMVSPTKKLRVVELFAGVGGFRLGLEGWKGRSPISGYKDRMPKNYEVIWSNQWEPSTKMQHANLIYTNKWPASEHNEQNIENVIKEVPAHDLLVGGFPCQDYSVATTLKNSKGLIGKKGILWWSIYSILKDQGEKKPKYLILENVDRLLVSPAPQRGRDFAIILSCLNELGYNAEWRVINAADYGMPQRRRRVFIIGYLKNTSISKKLKKVKNDKDWICSNGVLASAFEVDQQNLGESCQLDLNKTPKELSENFNLNGGASPFFNSGILNHGKVFTLKTTPTLSQAKNLESILIEEDKVEDEFYIDPKQLLKRTTKKYQIDKKEPIILRTELDLWRYLKGPKKEERINKINKFKYKYAEGRMKFPDDKQKPSRTIITGEGGPSPSRFKHVIKVGNRFRRLTPIELERLNMFPDDHTLHKDVSSAKRAFFMGNALVVGVIEKIGVKLWELRNQL